MATHSIAELAHRFLEKEKSTDWRKDPRPRDWLQSEWAGYYFPDDFASQGRWEGEVDRLVVWGEIPKELDGTFYRIHVDPIMRPDPRNGFTDGDGNLCAIRFQDGNVSMKVRYVETERYLLERKAGRRLFGIYRNPYTNDSSTFSANDTPANTNVVYWNGNLLALAERGLPWAVDPDTLETRRYDPFGGKIKTKTFTAHPKVDPKTNELVVWGNEAKGLGTTDVVTYSVTAKGEVKDVNWFNVSEVRMTHDGWITENWIILSALPLLYGGEEQMKAGGQHWVYDPEKPQIFIVCPRRLDAPAHPGWKVGEFREYSGGPGIIVHAGAAWEEDDGRLKLEGPWGQWNVMEAFNKQNHVTSEVTGTYIRWTVDLNQPTGSKLEFEEILPLLTEFPILDDRFLTSHTTITFLVGMGILNEDHARGFPLMDYVMKLDTKTNKTLSWHAGEYGRVTEPVFIPRSDEAPEGDGWVVFWTVRPTAPRGEIILLDSNDFTKPVAVIAMPFLMRDQLHGNWVPNPNPGTKLPRLTKPLKFVQNSGLGPLNRLP